MSIAKDQNGIIAITKQQIQAKSSVRERPSEKYNSRRGISSQLENKSQANTLQTPTQTEENEPIEPDAIKEQTLMRKEAYQTLAAALLKELKAKYH